MKFFRTLVATTLGTLLALFLLFIIILITIVSSTGEPEPYIRDNSVLKIAISGDIPSRHIFNPFDEIFGRKDDNRVSLESLKENLAKAASHDKISGVWLEIDFVEAGWANLQEAHRLISAFRDSSKKFVYASTNDIGLNEKGYFLATAADSVFSPPESFFEFDGFYSQVMFLTGLFEKLGIDAEVTRHGKYKSAVEPYFRKELSEESKYQLEQLVEDITATFVDAVSAKTGKSSGEINALLNNTPSLSARAGFEQGLLDTLLYTEGVEKLIKKRLGLKASASLQTVSNARYTGVSRRTAGLDVPSTKNKIAVIYAAGAIIPAMNSNSPLDNQQFITAPAFRKQLEEIRNDNNVKALVVRINSPGGSASTSDAIWNMLRETTEDLPVIVSMGPVAASGGYYIAMAADTIVAEPTTITGSIGVFGTKFNARQLFNEELGITFDEVKSHNHADWLTSTRGFTPSEEKAFQQFIDRTYHTFISKAAEARGLSIQEVDKIAQGRVWTGTDAKDQQLVDILGGLETAIEVAAEKAGITDYALISFPRQKNLFQFFMSSAETKVKAMLKSLWFGDIFPNEATSQFMLMKNRGPLLLMPFDITIQ